MLHNPGMSALLERGPDLILFFSLFFFLEMFPLGDWSCYCLFVCCLVQVLCYIFDVRVVHQNINTIQVYKYKELR